MVAVLVMVLAESNNTWLIIARWKPVILHNKKHVDWWYQFWCSSFTKPYRTRVSLPFCSAILSVLDFVLKLATSWSHCGFGCSKQHYLLQQGRKRLSEKMNNSLIRKEHFSQSFPQAAVDFSIAARETEKTREWESDFHDYMRPIIFHN